jgi:hypothetical protein
VFYYSQNLNSQKTIMNDDMNYRKNDLRMNNPSIEYSYHRTWPFRDSHDYYNMQHRTVAPYQYSRHDYGRSSTDFNESYSGFHEQRYRNEQWRHESSRPDPNTTHYTDGQCARINTVRSDRYTNNQFPINNSVSNQAQSKKPLLSFPIEQNSHSSINKENMTKSTKDVQKLHVNNSTPVTSDTEFEVAKSYVIDKPNKISPLPPTPNVLISLNESTEEGELSPINKRNVSGVTNDLVLSSSSESEMEEEPIQTNRKKMNIKHTAKKNRETINDLSNDKINEASSISSKMATISEEKLSNKSDKKKRPWTTDKKEDEQIKQQKVDSRDKAIYDTIDKVIANKDSSDNSKKTGDVMEKSSSNKTKINKHEDKENTKSKSEIKVNSVKDAEKKIHLIQSTLDKVVTNKTNRVDTNTMETTENTKANSNKPNEKNSVIISKTNSEVKNTKINKPVDIFKIGKDIVPSPEIWPPARKHNVGKIVKPGVKSKVNLNVRITESSSSDELECDKDISDLSKNNYKPEIFIDLDETDKEDRLALKYARKKSDKPCTITSATNTEDKSISAKDHLEIIDKAIKDCNDKLAEQEISKVKMAQNPESFVITPNKILELAQAVSAATKVINFKSQPTNHADINSEDKSRKKDQLIATPSTSSQVQGYNSLNKEVKNGPSTTKNDSQLSISNEKFSNTSSTKTANFQFAVPRTPRMFSSQDSFAYKICNWVQNKELPWHCENLIKEASKIFPTQNASRIGHRIELAITTTKEATGLLYRQGLSTLSSNKANQTSMNRQLVMEIGKCNSYFLDTSDPNKSEFSSSQVYHIVKHVTHEPKLIKMSRMTDDLLTTFPHVSPNLIKEASEIVTMMMRHVALIFSLPRECSGSQEMAHSKVPLDGRTLNLFRGRELPELGE